MMEEVDSILQAQNVPIHARELRACVEVARILNVEVIVTGPLVASPKPEVYEVECLSSYISEWLHNRYGERLKMDWSIGLAPIMIRGDPWLLKYPFIYGEIIVVCDRDLHRKFPSYEVAQPGEPPKKPVMNLLTCVNELPDGLASQLTDEELEEIIKNFFSGHEFFSVLDFYCKTDELAMLALNDLKSAAISAVSHNSERGQSRWESLQAAEKVLKYFISKRGGNYPKSHNLKALAELATNFGLPEIDNEDINKIQCSAEVRYSLGTHDIEEVIAAHYAAIAIGTKVTSSLFR